MCCCLDSPPAIPAQNSLKLSQPVPVSTLLLAALTQQQHGIYSTTEVLTMVDCEIRHCKCRIGLTAILIFEWECTIKTTHHDGVVVLVLELEDTGKEIKKKCCIICSLLLLCFCLGENKSRMFKGP